MSARDFKSLGENETNENGKEFLGFVAGFVEFSIGRTQPKVEVLCCKTLEHCRLWLFNIPIPGQT